jgi:hypothetical protein
MSSDRDVARTVRSWLEEGATSLPDRVLDEVLDQLPATRQRRARWPAWRMQQMNAPLKIVIATLAIGLFAVVGLGLGLAPRSEGPGGQVAAPSPTPIPMPQQTTLAAGTYEVMPFIPGPERSTQEDALCLIPAQSGCEETTADDGMRFTFTVPDGWASVEQQLAGPTWAAPGGAGLMFHRGGWLFSDPCIDAVEPDIPVGPSVDDFVTALVDHPLLDVTQPVDVTVAGYQGKYVQLQAPSDTAACPYFFAYRPGIYEQGPDQRWQLWVLDVDGLRVVVRADTYPGTQPEVRQQLQGIVDSLRIEVPVVAEATASPSPSS